MTFGLECKKIKRTGFIPTFIVGGLLAAAVPVVNMAVRSETYLGLESSPIQILMDANWQMMAMLNVLLLVAGACLMYHTEYADNAIQKMYMLPIKKQNLFFGKTVLIAVMGIVILIFEAIGIAFCSILWFELSGKFVLSIFPFALPFQTFAGATGNVIRNTLIASVVETVIIAIAEVLLLKVRRSME